LLVLRWRAGGLEHCRYYSLSIALTRESTTCGRTDGPVGGGRIPEAILSGFPGFDAHVQTRSSVVRA
jgi:hypothetical protein